MSQTIDRIVEASKLPLSIVIVGVGYADFSKMVYFKNGILIGEVLFTDFNKFILLKGSI